MSIKIKFNNIVAFLLGLLICNNTIYVAKIGETYINIALVFGLAIFIMYFIINKNLIAEKIGCINKYYMYFVYTAIFSIMPATIVFINDIEILISLFNGWLYLIMYIILFVDVLMMEGKKKHMLYGLAIGYALNILLSLVQYVTYKSGNYFSLYTYFPQPAFQINSYFGTNNALQKSTDTFNIYGYRAQGFFLETSYYMAFLAGTTAVLMSSVKNRMLKIAVGIVFVFTTIISSTGNMIVVIASILVYAVISRIKFKNIDGIKYEGGRTVRTILICFAIFLVVLLKGDSLIKELKVNNYEDTLKNNIATANIQNKSNTSRYNSMKYAAALIPRYPLGVGYNLSYDILRANYDSGLLEKNTSFNYLITIFLEQGIIGAIFYLLFIYTISIKLILVSKDKYQIALGVCSLAIFICQVGNGVRLYPFIIFIYALSTMELNKSKMEVKIGEENWNNNIS